MIDELFKAKYTEKNADFFDLIEHFCPTTSDIALKNLILQVYRFASSMPYPKKWLDKCANSFDIEKTDDISDTVWGSFIKKKLKTDTTQITEILSRCIALCEKEDISYPKISDLASRAEMSAKLIDSDITRLYAYMSSEKIPNFTNTDAKKTAPDTITNIKVLLNSSRNRDAAEQLELQFEMWKVFLEIMKNYVLIGDVEKKA